MNEYQKCLDYVKSKLESAKHIEIMLINLAKL